MLFESFFKNTSNVMVKRLIQFKSVNGTCEDKPFIHLHFMAFCYILGSYLRLRFFCQRLISLSKLSETFLIRGPCGAVTNMLDSNIVVGEFNSQSRYYVHFWANTIGKGMNPLTQLRYELNSTTTVQ